MVLAEMSSEPSFRFWQSINFLLLNTSPHFPFHRPGIMEWLCQLKNCYWFHCTLKSYLPHLTLLSLLTCNLVSTYLCLFLADFFLFCLCVCVWFLLAFNLYCLCFWMIVLVSWHRGFGTESNVGCLVRF